MAFWGNEFYSLITLCVEVLCLLLICSLVISFDVSCSSCKKQWIIPYSWLYSPCHIAFLNYKFSMLKGPRLPYSLLVQKLFHTFTLLSCAYILFPQNIFWKGCWHIWKFRKSSPSSWIASLLSSVAQAGITSIFQVYTGFPEWNLFSSHKSLFTDFHSCNESDHGLQNASFPAAQPQKSPSPK